MDLTRPPAFGVHRDALFTRAWYRQQAAARRWFERGPVVPAPLALTAHGATVLVRLGTQIARVAPRR